MMTNRHPCFRLYDSEVVTNRLLGTKVILIGSTTNTTCGTINSVNPSGASLDAQTYKVPCPATREPTLAVLLYDDVMEETKDKNEDKLVMNIAEVVIYEKEGIKSCQNRSGDRS